ncbi:MAG: isoprenylcysteine carboxylmethyltransferase family protein [Burkholderiaceae bacterium]
MRDYLPFFFGTACFSWISRHALFNPRAHGFYRFFAWEAILALVLMNFPRWTEDPFAPHQLVSWALLIVSAFLVLQGLHLLVNLGKPAASRADTDLFAFERTSELVTTGVFRYIRHPMYASLLFLAWGAFLKDVSMAGGLLALVASVALLLTALRDEAECRAYFGDAYLRYAETNKRFIPFVF